MVATIQTPRVITGVRDGSESRPYLAWTTARGGAARYLIIFSACIKSSGTNSYNGDATASR